jgi:tetratricopeptide (TPR) repeat protein
MRSFWILVSVALLAFGPVHVIAQQAGSATSERSSQQPAVADTTQKVTEKKADNAPATKDVQPPAKTSEQGATTGADKPVKTNPFAPENQRPKVKSDNPFPTDDAPTAPLPRIESLPQADTPKPGDVGWSSSLDRADSSIPDSSSQGAQAPPITELDLEIRAKEDIRIARYYASIGSWKGALGRFQSAFQNAKDDEDAVCGLAEAERHLGFSNEAILHYTECLHLNPTGAYSRSAEKALKSLTAHR